MYHPLPNDGQYPTKYLSLVPHFPISIFPFPFPSSFSPLLAGVVFSFFFSISYHIIFFFFLHCLSRFSQVVFHITFQTYCIFQRRRLTFFYNFFEKYLLLLLLLLSYSTYIITTNFFLSKFFVCIGGSKIEKLMIFSDSWRASSCY
jgi:hypothetical protein